MNDADEIHSPGMLILVGDKIAYVGAPTEIPYGAEVLDLPKGWATPGLVDLHTHIHGPGINDMVHAVNPELRARPCVIPAT